MIKPETEDAVFGTFPLIETERLILRQITMADRAAIFRIFSDTEVTRYNVVEIFQNIGDAERLVTEIQDDFKNRVSIRWGITMKDRGTVIGLCTMYNWQRSGIYAHCCSVGFEMARTYWQRGYATEALQAVLDFGFEKMDLNRIEATMMLENDGAIDLLLKFGFQLEGILRERGYWKNQFHDVRQYALLKRDWEADNARFP